MHPRISGQGWLPRYGGGWMHPFGHIYALQQELLNPNASNWFHASELWCTARKEGVALNVAHASNLLRQCVQPAAWEQALVVLAQMQRESLRPDVVCVGSILAACTEAGQYTRVEEVFAAYARTMQLDSVCYLALIRSRVERGDAAGAVAAGREQEKDGVPFLPHTFTFLLEACEAADDALYALQLVQRMESQRWLAGQRDKAAVRQLARRHPTLKEELRHSSDFRLELEDGSAGSLGN